MTEYIDIISLGGGTQSSAMHRKAERGEFKINGEVVIPKMSIFADPGNEPAEVYEFMEWLKETSTVIPIITTTAGNIIDDTLTGIRDQKNFKSAPFFVKTKEAITEPVIDTVIDENGEFQDIDRGHTVLGYKEGQGRLWRQCTEYYKIAAIRREIRKQLGYGPRDRIKEKIRLWMGISTDEAHRMTDSNVKYIEHHYPLIDENMSRFDCIKWMVDEGFPTPPKSACIVCPYHNDDYWKRMRDNDPESFQMAIDFDKQIRHMPGIDGEVYLHRSMIPLDQVEFKLSHEQIDMFGEECSGMCGL